MNVRQRVTSLVATCAISMAFAATAAAEGREFDVYGGRGGATWDWQDRYSIVNLRVVAWDQACNAEGIYAYVRIHDSHGTNDIGRVDDKGGCQGGHEERNGMTWDNTRGRIDGITVFLCRDNDGSDECVGEYYENPLP